VATRVTEVRHVLKGHSPRVLLSLGWWAGGVGVGQVVWETRSCDWILSKSEGIASEGRTLYVPVKIGRTFP